MTLTTDPLRIAGATTLVQLMPGWLQVVSRINPLSYEVDGLRGLLIGTHAALAVDFAVLVSAMAGGVVAASALLGRLARG